MGSVRIEHLHKQFNGITALEDVNLEIREGEFFALLGPSGCGKTTTMRCVAGFESPTSGKIFIGERDVSHVPANQRNCGMVFQSYALFPHLSVFENVAYSLQVRRFYQGGLGTKLSVLAHMLNRKLGKVDKEIEQKVRDALDFVELGHLADRLPGQLSGGQQQRVALARALIMEPAVLLMDEPLSNLDKKLRNSMRVTIRRIQQKVGITTIFVTHDQEEAMSMADRVAVMQGGKLVQVDTPTSLYSQPASTFVADFVGSSNIFKATVKESGEAGTVLQLVGDGIIRSAFSTNRSEVDVIIRPESIRLFADGAQADAGDNLLEGTILMSTYLGATIRYDVQVGQLQMEVDKTFEAGSPVLPAGTNVKLAIDPNVVVIL
ncbi:ABC-type Fe3+/spermidine/putrescine transport system ATPase subunit [Brevibacillus aydinogluensis]|jgi:ABC-type Fe3+/spermidine/putrescine transport system ATPase subunit|uniref:ABC transporter ATP-binding protein n=1 Tax=Brevibacillus aydinogluensis TaxID=927786 RepID=A0AA48RIJ1_9BACL|nr:ABC transporter ATP-binding protein [Brevibacillus aydinogluensis]MDT3417568.1 ABC-type Fe3+/spermidine/putrescine transport system ATPase subunit [Brevibacillus aydinogluensis]CAJ1003833.1 ABC transporter ATP-binding protein [Brevibacillus aydinogluensis]